MWGEGKVPEYPDFFFFLPVQKLHLPGWYRLQEFPTAAMGGHSKGHATLQMQLFTDDFCSWMFISDVTYLIQILFFFFFF
jgi:hypothetical protein